MSSQPRVPELSQPTKQSRSQLSGRVPHSQKQQTTPSTSVSSLMGSQMSESLKKSGLYSLGQTTRRGTPRIIPGISRQEVKITSWQCGVSGAGLFPVSYPEVTEGAEIDIVQEEVLEEQSVKDVIDNDPSGFIVKTVTY